VATSQEEQALGLEFKQQGRWGDAAQAFERAIGVDPDYAPSYFELADLSQTLGQADAAIKLYLRTINLDSGNIEAFRRLGELLYARQNWVGAEHCFARVVETDYLNGDLEARLGLMNKLGIALIRQDKLDAAAATINSILTHAPSIGEMHSNLAYIYERQGRLEEALAAGLRTVELKPDYPEGHNNLGIAFRAVHLLDDARRCFAEAVALKPDFALGQFNLGALDLMQGDFKEGWRGYEWRNQVVSQPPRQLAVSRWQGEPLPGKTLLVHTEQGYGDTILFSRFLKTAKDRSQAHVILEGPAALLPLLSGIEGADQVLQFGTSLPHVDAEIALPSLSGVLGIELGDLPVEVSYLGIPETYRTAWRERMKSQAAADGPQAAANSSRVGPLRTGIVWTGNPSQELNGIRSCSPSHFACLATIPGIAWFSLQKEADEPALHAAWPAGAPITALGQSLHDFADTAAAIGQLDLVISVDTAVAHLSGALGQTTWTLLSHTPDWRWQLDRNDSAWYPSMRLFRQPRWGDWQAVFESVAAALRELIAARARD
jgi:tetratricopeptide (TPR) repeat protein